MKLDKFKIKNYKDNPHTNNKVNLEEDNFVTGSSTETERAASAKTMINIHNEFSNMFKGIGCFKGTFSLKVKEDANSY